MDTCTSAHVKSVFKSGTCPIYRRPPVRLPPSLPLAKEGDRVVTAAGDLHQRRETTMCESLDRWVVAR